MRDEAELRARAEEMLQVPWHHSMRLLPGLEVRGGKPAELLAQERACILESIDLSGRSVLDVGTWNGYFAFEAKRAGAARVIASDSYCWAEPKFRGRETFEFARDCLGLEVEAKFIDPTELPGDLDPVDVVLFLGVFYHMHDPIAVTKSVTGLAREVLVIETHQDLLGLNRPAMAFYPGATLANDPTNWWGPNPECMYELLVSLDMPVVYYQHHPTARQGRGIYHAFRSKEAAHRSFRKAPDNRRVFDLSSPAGQRAIFSPR